MAELLEPTGFRPKAAMEPRANILLVDDNPANLLALGAILDDLGLNLVEVRSGEEALIRLRQDEFAVVLLDVQMPGLNGFETAKLMREQNSGLIPIIFLTAFESDRFPVEQAYSLGAVDFLVKPLIPIIVRAKVAGFVELFEKTQQIKRQAELLREAERQRFERSVQEQQEWFRVTLASIGDAVIATDTQGLVTFLNAVAEDLTGWTEADAKGRSLETVFRILHEQTRQPVENPVATVLKEGRVVAMGNHTVLVARNGTVKPIDDSAAPILDSNGSLLGVVLIFRDVTEQRRNEQEVRQSEARKSAILETALDCIITMDHEGKVVEFNPAAEKTFGYSRGEVVGQELARFIIPPSLRERHRTGMAHFLATGEGPVFDQRLELPALRADGSEFPVELAITRLNVNGLPLFTAYLRNISERKQQEAALRESEEKLRLLADTIPQLAWMARPDGHIFWYNRRWYEYTGTSPAEMEGWGWQSVHHPDVLPKVLERWKKSIASGEPFDMVFPLKGANGQFRPFLTRVNPLTNESGQILYWFGTNTDIAELREAREALVVSEERLRLALDAGRMGVWDWNIRTGELGWSDSLEPLHGLAPGTFGGTFDHFQQLIHPEDRELVNAAIRQALQSRGEFYVEFRNVWQNGGIHWIAGSGKVFPGDDGQPLRMIGIGLDVTLRKRAEQTSRFLADASAALAVLVDFDSTLQKVSSLAVPSFADWATVDLAEADGSLRRVSVSHMDPAKVQLAHDVHRRFPPDPAAPQGVWNILRTGRSEIVPEITDELLVQSANDDELLSIMRQLGLKSYIGVPLTVRGKTLGVITFINAESGHRYDETDLAVAEDLAGRAAIAIENAQLYRELRDADQRKDEFLATLAHELRNPLAPIRNGLQVLRLAGGGGAMVDEARSMMERQLSQMVRLVDDLLDVSRITRNKLELRKERVSLAAVIHSAVETSGPLMEQAGHTFSLTLPPAPVYLDADLTRLAQVFSNLLNNAAKYTEPGGRISLTGELSAAEVLVEVRDTGLGIPADALPRIFEMFSQVDRNMGRSQGGLGIGLTLVRRLVEMHNGTVEARSQGPGTGSQFVVRLPVVKATPRVATSQGDDGLSASTKRRILVVDDNHDSAISLSMMLKLMGNETHTAHDGLAAVEVAETFRPDLILLDIGLPKLNGYDACRQIRERPWSKEIVIVALTGWGQDEDRRRSQEAGFDHHLVKPFEMSALQTILRDSC